MFQGFADTQGKFFRMLKKHQDRDWFLANKEAFETGWNAPMKALLEDVHGKVQASFKHSGLERPRVFRIYRDVRFSKDKSPFKEHVAGRISVRSVGGTTEKPIALYVHVGANEVRAGAGTYMLSTSALPKYRAAVADPKSGAALVRILKGLTAKGYDLHSFESTKRVPAGYPADHPRAEHLCRKGLVAMFPDLKTSQLTSAKFVDVLAKHVKETRPLVDWLVQATT